jgi:hypothetical protein
LTVVLPSSVSEWLVLTSGLGGAWGSGSSSYIKSFDEHKKPFGM